MISKLTVAAIIAVASASILPTISEEEILLETGSSVSNKVDKCKKLKAIPSWQAYSVKKQLGKSHFDQNYRIVGMDYPGDLCCTLYDNFNFEGNHITKCLDNAQAPQSFDLYPDGWINRIYSWQCGQSIQYDFCNYHDYDCDNGGGSGGAGAIENACMGNYKDTDLIMMKPYNSQYQAAVTLFQDADCVGQSTYYPANENASAPAQYPLSEMEERNFDKKKSAASIMIPYGYYVDLFSKAGFTGDSISLTGGYWAEASQQSMNCINLKDESQNLDFAGKTQSLTVHKNPDMNKPAVGMWQSITASDEFKFKVSYGWTSTDSETSTETQMSTLDYQMGFKFLFYKTGIDYKYSHTLTTQTQLDETEDYSAVFDFKCDDLPKGETGVGLWQWVTLSNDYKSRVYGKHTVCRYGENFNMPPECPWNACIDGACTQCTDNWQA